VIAIGLAGIALAWLYVRRLTASVVTADVAALLLALLPFYWLNSRTSMTDGPTIAFILLALMLVDLAWAQRAPRASHVVLVGCIGGLGMLLRGTNLCLVLVPLAYAVGARKAIVSPLRRLALLALHGIAFCIPSLFWVARNASIDKRGLGIDGVDEFRMLLISDWLDPESLFSAGEFLQKSIENFLWHAIYRVPEQLIPGLWNAEWWNWPGAPFAAVGLTLVLALTALPLNIAGLPLALTIVPYAAFLSVFPRGGAIRYWAPVTSLLIVLIVINWSSILRSRLGGRAHLTVVVGLTAAYAANLAVFAQRFEAHPYADDFGDMVALFDRVPGLQTPPPAVHAYHSGLFTLRTGLAAPITVAGRSIEPIYTHLILPEAGNPTGSVRQPPPGATLLLRQGPWGYYALPKPMTERELNSPKQ
jgi:4-amino-4-deoxy-L-arabinose transferase-like glycosyltransferase